MLGRTLKWGTLGFGGTLMLGLLIFGGELASYVMTSGRSVRSAVKENVPVEFELQRARDLVDQIVPELQANIRLIAQEEVAVVGLEKEIALADQRTAELRREVAQLRTSLQGDTGTYYVGHRPLSRDQLVERLAQRFERLKAAETSLNGKYKLLQARQKSLSAAQDMLARAREQKLQLEQKIESLVAQHRLLQASETTVALRVDGRQLTKADRLVADIQKRLDVAQRVLAHESELIDAESPSVWDESGLLAEVDAHLGHPASQAEVAQASETRGDERH